LIFAAHDPAPSLLRCHQHDHQHEVFMGLMTDL
jgi:hypothetical protein